MDHDEVREYRAALPQVVKSRLLGKTLVIENLAHFHAWLEPDGHGKAWWQRLSPWT